MPSSFRDHLDLVVAPPTIDEGRGEPAHDEDADDHEAEIAEIILHEADPAPHAAGERELVGDEPQRLDAADDERHDDRNEGDRHVVIELADGLDEGPAIGAEHQDAVGRIDERHAGGEERREGEDRPDRQPVRGLGGGDAEEADLRRRVEAEPEQEAERIHVPALADEAEERPEDPAEDAAPRKEDLEILLDQRRAAADGAKGTPDGGEDDDVDRRDRQEEKRRNPGTDDAADFPEALEARLERA